MRKIGALAGALVLGTTLSGCWEQPGFDAGHTNWNPGESVLTPATVDDAVELWSYDTGDDPVIAPLSVSGKVYAGDATGPIKGAVALDAATGALVWATSSDQLPEGVVSDLAYLGGNLHFSWSQITFGGFATINASTGALTFTGGAGGNGNSDVAVVDGLRVVRGQGQNRFFPGQVATWVLGPHCDVRFIAPFGDPNGGKAFAFVGTNLMWSFGTEARGYRDCDTSSRAYATTWTTQLGGTPTGVAAVGANGAVYVDDTGTVTLVDATTGAVQWTAEAGAGTTGPTVADGKVLVTTGDSRLVAYAADTGAQLWEATLPANGSAVVAGGEVAYVAAGTDIVAFAVDGCGAASCPALTTIPVGATVSGGPIVDDGRIVVGTSDGRVVAFGLAA